MYERILTHDLILGDFGRGATLDYFSKFSEQEQEVCSKRLRPAQPFLDEHRVVSYTVIGALPQIKKHLFPATESALTGDVLVGIEGGPPISAIFHTTFEVIVPFLAAAMYLKPIHIRVILPCNTLAPLADWLAGVFRTKESFIAEASRSAVPHMLCQTVVEHMEAIGISVPSLPLSVLADVAGRGCSKMYLLASQTAFLYYKKLATRSFPNLAIERWLPPGYENFEHLLVEAIQAPAKLDLRTPVMTAPGICCVSGCTDIRLPGILDSLSIFTRKMVEEVYGMDSSEVFVNECQ